jgi:hypothetical protein
MTPDRNARDAAGAPAGHEVADAARPPLVENAVTRRFLDRWDGTAPTRLKELAGDGTRPLTVGTRFLTRPAFLDDEGRRLVIHDINALLDLLFTLPGRLFDGDLKAMADAVGLEPVQADAIVRTATGRRTSLGRADFFYDGREFKLLEFNVSSALGGWDMPIVTRRMLRDGDLASFVDDEGLSYTDSLAAIADVLRDECAALDCPSRPVVALVDWPASYPTFGPILDSMAGLLDPLGFEAIGCHAGQLIDRDGHLYVDGRHVDVVYRFIQLGDLLEPNALAVVEPIIAAAERGTVHLVTPFEAGLFASKGCLALLYDDHRDVFSPAEHELIDRILPWTRVLQPCRTSVDGRSVDLIDYVLANRSDLVLKPALLSGGTGVLQGWKTDQRTWARTVRTGARDRLVVQRRVRPSVERFPADDPARRWAELVLNWGVFVTGRTYGGSFVRALPDLDPGVINTHAGAAVAGVFDAPA